LGRSTKQRSNPALAKAHEKGAQVAVVQILTHVPHGSVAYLWPRHWRYHIQCAERSAGRILEIHRQVLTIEPSENAIRLVADEALIEDAYISGGTMVSNAVRAVQHLAEEIERLGPILRVLRDNRPGVLEHWYQLYTLHFGHDRTFAREEFERYCGMDLDGVISSLLDRDIVALARNVQHLLLEESHLHRVADPASGMRVVRRSALSKDGASEQQREGDELPASESEFRSCHGPPQGVITRIPRTTLHASRALAWCQRKCNAF
jgi:hypothetical protein